MSETTGPLPSSGFAEHVEQAAQRRLAHRHRDWRPGVADLDAPLQAVRRAHGDRADDVVAEVLLHFEDQSPAALLDAPHRRGFGAVVGATARADRCGQVELEGVVDVGKVVRRELDVDDGTDDLGDSPRFRRRARGDARAFSLVKVMVVCCSQGKF